MAVKFAGMTAPDGEFEKKFLSFAQQEVMERVPALTPYLRGFEIFDINDDKTHAAAVFGFDLDGKMVYVPVVFDNGNLKGHEMMHVADGGINLPTSDGWIQLLLGRAPIRLGDPAQAKSRPTAPSDIRSLFSSAGKMGRAKVAAFLDEVIRQRGFGPTDNAASRMYAAITTDPDRFDRVHAKRAAYASLPVVLTRLPQLAKAASWLARVCPQFARGVDQFYPGLVGKFAALALSPVSIVPTPPKVAERKSVSVVTREMLEELPDMPVRESVRSDAIRTGYGVDDERDPIEFSRVVDGNGQLQNIPGPGFFPVVTAEGEVVPCGVFATPSDHPRANRNARLCFPVGTGGRSGKYLVIAAKDTSRFAEENGENVTVASVAPCPRPENFPGKDELPPEGMAKDDDRWKRRYTVFGPDFQALPPFSVDSRTGQVLRVSWCGQTGLPDRIRFADDATEPDVSTAHVTVPASWSFFRLPDQGEAPTLVLGPPQEIFKRWTKTAEVLRVRPDPAGVRLNDDRPVPAAKVAERLLRDYAIPEPAVREILSRPGDRTYYVKRADYMPPPIASVMAPTSYGIRGGRSVPMQPYREDAFLAESRSNSRPQYEAPGEESVQMMQKGMEQGQKSMFDIGALAALAKSMNHGPVNEDDADVLMPALDEIGRQRLKFLLCPTAFADRYGTQALEQIDRMSRSCFEGLGDLVLFLKTKGQENPNRIDGSVYE